MVLYRIATNSLFTWKETLAMHKQFLYWYMSPVFYNTNWTQTKATRSPYFAQTKWMVKQLLAPLMKLCQRDACWLFTVCQHNSVSICCQVGVIGEMWQILGNHAPYALNYTHAMHHDSITPFIIKTSSKMTQLVTTTENVTHRIQHIPLILHWSFTEISHMLFTAADCQQ